ncbi:MAG: substrate-binding domain-containing protein [Actinomycetes bacterium]
MLKKNRSKAAAVAVTTFGLCLGAVAPALADVQPSANDVVAAGSDTTMYAANFLFDGVPGGGGGYNAGKKNRVFSFDAVGDANGRTSYENNATGAAAFAATAVLRQQTKPVIRPNGSGNGIKALYQAPYISPGPVVNVARSSRLPQCAENTADVNAGFGGLHVYQMGTEPLTMAKLATGSHVPDGLTADQVLKIYTGAYTKWGDIPGYSGSFGTDTIDALIPQSGSGTRGVFDDSMKAANGGTAPTYKAGLEVVQENDFNSLQIATDPANALVVFSNARITLNDTGYFGGTGATAAAGKVVPMTGAAPGGGTVYGTTRPVFFVINENSLSVGTKFQPGGTKNWAQELFSGPGNVLASPIYASNISAAGFTPSYSDLGAPGQQGVNCT